VSRAGSRELALERRAARLEGEVLAAVLYQQLRWSGPAEWAGEGPHSVELAVHLQMASGRRFSITWADELELRHGFGVAVDEVRVLDPDRGPLHDLSHASPWAGLLGRRVQRGRVHWRPVERALRSSLRAMVAVHADHLSRLDFPQTLELELEEAGSVYLAAARLHEGGALGFTNHLLVLFTRGELERLGLG